MRADARHIIATEESDDMIALTAGISYLIGGVATPMAPLDSDHDGVIDSRDRCPETPGGVKVDSDGCPLDSDGDGVADFKDQCPDTPRVIKVDAGGYPVDSDGDGVIDDKDQCPGTPKGELIDEVGCSLKLTLNINFDFDQAVIKPEFKDDLDRAATFVKKYDQVPYILFAGHTNSVGNEAYILELSMKRADAVRQYLIDHYGIDGKRLVTRGYGETQPVASNETEEGRYQNRRVELICCIVIPD